MKKQKLSKQVILCIVVIFFILISFSQFSKENEQHILEHNMEYVENSTVQIAGRIDNVFTDGYENIQILSSFLSQSLNQPEVDIKLVRKIAQNSVFDFLEFADKDGMDHNITGGVSDARDRQYYLDGIKGNSGLDVVFDSRATHETLLMFYSPVTFEGEIVGVLIGVYQADNKMKELLSAEYFGEPANLYLCMPEGRVVASNQYLDTKAKLYVTDLAKDDKEWTDSMQQAIQDGGSSKSSVVSQKSCGCMTRLPESGWYLVQKFPKMANTAMIEDANAAGFRLEIHLLIVFGIVLIILVYFHRKERRNITEIAEERGEYKNAVLADAFIRFEANLTKNEILEGVWKNDDGSITSVEDLVGIPLPCDYDTYIVRWADAYIDESDRDLFLENNERNYLIRLFEQGRSEVTFEYYAKSQAGKKIFVRRSAYLAADKKSGDIIAYHNVKDITEQKQKESQMHQYEQMLVMTTSELCHGIRQIDLSDFSTVYLSFEDNHIVPCDEEDWDTWLVGQERFVHSDDIEELKEELEREKLLAMPVGGKIRCDFRSSKKRNGLHKVFTTSAYKVERDGKQYINLITMDNTKVIEDELRQKALIEDALYRAESASKAKTKFLSNMSHDIRTPMNAIIGFTTLATMHIDNKEQVEGYLEKISMSSNHLLSLINDVLDMSRIESGRLQMEEVECNLLAIMQELENMMTIEMQSRNLEFHINLEGVSDVQIICDKLRLNQVLLNLLSNAMKYTKAGGRVDVRIHERDGKVKDEVIYEFGVKDTGIGMSREFQKHLFEPFERERNSTISGIQGTGLGLTITKNIVEMMGGTISVSSEKDKGTEFTVLLPVKKVSKRKSEPVRREEDSTPLTKVSLEGKRILLVEDNSLNREIAGEILGEAGILVEEAEDGSIALEMLYEKGPGYYDLVLMDVQMPIMDGYTTTQEIRSFENKELANIPIIAMTANAFEEDKKKALEMGMNAHIAKPVDVEQLLAALEQILAAK